MYNNLFQKLIREHIRVISLLEFYTCMVSFDPTESIYLLLTSQKSVLQLKFTKSL